MAEAGVQVDEQLVVGESFLEEAGYCGMRKLLCAKHRPTAVFAFGNLLALGADARGSRARPDDSERCFSDRIRRLSVRGSSCRAADHGGARLPGPGAAGLRTTRRSHSVGALHRKIVLPRFHSPGAEGVCATLGVTPGPGTKAATRGKPNLTDKGKDSGAPFRMQLFTNRRLR